MMAHSRRIALRTHDLACGYRRPHTLRAVIEGISVTVHEGDLVCLLGPNGIGKSTLLRTLAAMQPPLAGRVELRHRDAHAMGAAELATILAIVLTERGALAGLTSRRVVELGRYPHTGWFGRVDEAHRQIVDGAIDAVGVRHLADRDVSQLSDGERQRVMIARALAQQPSVLILDEPTAFLDLPSRVELMTLLRDLSRRHDVAVIVSSHDLELAIRVADVLWLVMPGGGLAIGAPEDVMLSGAIADAFDSSRVRFDLADRAFRLLTGGRGHARVLGSGVRASLAASVLEREGYSAGGPGESAVVTVTVDDTGWQAVIHNGRWHGADFASLAASLRRGAHGHEKHQHDAR